MTRQTTRYLLARTAVVVALSIPVTVSALASFAYFLRAETNQSYQDLQTEVHDVVLIGIDVVMKYDVSVVHEQILERLEGYRGFLGAVILDTDRMAILVQPTDFEVPTKIMEAVFADDIVEVGTTTYSGGIVKDKSGEVLGHYVLAFSTAHLLESELRALWLAICVALPFLLSFIGFVGWRVTRNQQELRRVVDAESQASATKNQFLANISHELRTPLHGILSFAAFGIERQYKAERRKLGRYFAQIDRCGQSLLGLLNDLLDVARLEEGKMELTVRLVDLAPLVSSVVEEFSGLLEQNSLRVETELDQSTIVEADAAKLTQLVRNLIGNAIKFTEPDGKIEVAVETVEKQARIIVMDEGIGIPEDELKTVFNQFAQSSRTMTGAGGTGLGLAICRQIAECHKGGIWAENRSRGGARIVVELPLLDCREGASGDDAAVPAGHTSA